MNDEQKLGLLDWIASQNRLRIEVWHYMGGVQKASVWTELDDEDHPSGKAPTAIEALVMAKQASEDELAR